MGYCPYYQAIPEDSDLFAMIQSDGLVARILAQLFVLGSRPFDFNEGPDKAADVADTLLWLAEEDAVSRGEVGAAFARSRSAVDAANCAHPGLIEQTAFLNKCQDDLEGRLIEVLERSGRSEASECVPILIRGAVNFGHPLVAGGFSLVPSRTVSEAALLLQTFDLDLLASGDESWRDHLEEDYEPWRLLYLEAARWGEAVLIL